MKTIILLFETDLYGSKNHRILLGAFSNKEKAVKMAKEKGVYNIPLGIQPLFIEMTINKYEEQ